MRKSEMRELAEHIYEGQELDPSEFKAQTPPVVTIYLPIQRDEREGRRSDWDRIEFKNLSNEAIKDLQKHWGKDATKGIVEKLEYIQTHEDMPLWLEANAGLAFLVNNDDCFVYNMDEKPEPKVVVGDKYDMSGLVSEAERDQAAHYKLLLLSSDFFALLEGDETSVRYVKFPDDVKHYLTQTYPEYDGWKAPLDYFSLEDHMSPFHDHKSRNDVTKEETKKFFRYVDKVLNDKLLLHNTEPVILVTLPEHVHEFRELCTFNHLEPKAIEKDPGALTGRQLRDDALKILGKD